MVLRNEGKEMDIALHITLSDGAHRVDNRLVTQALGIEHRSFMRSVQTYQSELSELGAVRFGIAPRKDEDKDDQQYRARHLTLSTTSPRKAPSSRRG